MKAKVTKTMKNFLNKNLKNNYCIECINYIEVTPQIYERYIDYDLFKNTIDYDINKSKFKALEIVYKDECYAMNNYITTNDLNKLAKSTQNHTEDEFIKAFKAAYEI